jgi:hypothetical protein
MGTIPSTLVPWRVDGPTTLHGFDDDLVYILVCADTADPELQRQVALVSAWDVEGEGYARTIAAVPRLLAACQAVVTNWERGDLAQAARLCAEAVEAASPSAPAAKRQQAMPRKTRFVEYYRLWGGDSGSWDTDFIDIPADTPDHKLNRAIREAAAAIGWREEVPVIVGYYADADDEEDKGDDEEPSCPLAQAPANPEDRELRLADLAAKAEAAGLRAEDFDETVHDLANSISADINNAGVSDQLRYLIQEWGHEAAAREIDRLAQEKVGGKIAGDQDAGMQEPDDGDPENVACVKCGRRDLSLHINGQCAECGPREDQAPQIRAECHSDDPSGHSNNQSCLSRGNPHVYPSR